MDPILIAEIVIAAIAIAAFVVAMYVSEAFRTAVFAFAKKKWRENKAWIYAALDAKIEEIAHSVDVEISAKTDKYIKQEILRRSIHNAVDGKASHAAEWAVSEYKLILQDLLNHKE